MTRIVLADDRALVREGIRRILADQSGLAVVAETTTGIDLLERVSHLTADVVLLGVMVDWARIVALIPTLRRARLRVLVLATDPDRRYVERAVNAGAAGVITTEATPAELADAIGRTAAGRPLRRTGPTAQHRGRPAERPLPELSAREYEVMRMIGGGQTVNEVADRLGLSPKTVGTYRSRIMDKLRLASTAELVRFALERGLAE